MNHMQTMVGTICLIVCAGAAHAQIERTRSGPQSFFTSNDAFSVDGIDGATGLRYRVRNNDLIGEDLRTFTDSFSISSGEFPSIASLQIDSSITTQASSTRFEASWSHTSVLNLNGPLADTDSLATNAGSLGLGSHFVITEDARIRISFSYSAGSLVGFALPEGDNSTVIEVSSGTDTFLPFVAGFGDDNVTVGNFSFELDMVAGTEFDVFMQTNFLQNADGTFQTGGWDQFQQGSFIVEVVPAPSAVLVLGVAGLAGTRRRRA